MSSSWISGGITRTLITDCNPGEGPEECEARHNATLAELKTIYPED